ncbi:TetR/AcrR family transcriptional regulator [Pseudonocardia abyssalis]|uniref:TetR/AcrR family transcriptional regulator n=1 Tax=Pseudonocardia abyssalis TaxID=2792008 RepID=UPI001CF6817F|nr:TetR/AcrR family transcriptional regulator [Pseudonocardia abyssalis]
MPPRKRLSAQDWVDAAYAALGDGGVAAVAVEPLAVRLGTTKGSFYWHFAGRDALLAAALAHWERVETEAVIALGDTQPDRLARMRALLVLALEPPGASVELALQPTADHPLVAPVLRRVTRRRLEYLGTTFRDLGFSPEESERRSLLAYTAYLGHTQLMHATPDLLPDLSGYVDTVVAALTRGGCPTCG